MKPTEVIDELGQLRARIAAKETELAPLLRDLETLKAEEATLKEQLRVWALDIHGEVGTRSFSFPHGGVQVRESWQVVVTDERALLAWVETHYPAMVRRQVRMETAKPVLHSLLLTDVNASIPGVKLEKRAQASVTIKPSAGGGGLRPGVLDKIASPSRPEEARHD